MGKKSYHVAPSPNGGWSVRRRGAARASKHFTNKNDAITWGREISKSKCYEFVIHKVDGTVQRKDSYGIDPSPPIDRK